MIKPWTAQELEVLAALYGKKMNWQIAALLPGRTDNGVKLKARGLGLKSNRTLTRKQYEVNRDYFRVPGMQNSYWAGFIAADGNIGDPKDRVRIKLVESDAAHLVTFGEHCGSTSPLRNEPNGPAEERTERVQELLLFGNMRRAAVAGRFGVQLLHYTEEDVHSSAADASDARLQPSFHCRIH